MKQKHIKLGTISEDFKHSNCMFTEADDRSYLYSTNAYKPCSSAEPIAWKDESLASIAFIPDIIEKGDKLVTRDIAQVIMSFDPYGVEVYPAKLIIENDVVVDRYILSVKNVIDVIDSERSEIYESYVDPSQPIVSRLAICPMKLNLYPLSKRLAFIVKGSNTIFFDRSIVDKFVEGLLDGTHYICNAKGFDTSVLAPIG